MSETLLGSLIALHTDKDAVHIAVAPVIAGESLTPGQHVGFIKTGEVGVCNAPIGIIDPFLKESVQKGACIWLCLYPKSTSSIRHDWQHPAFVVESQNVKDSEAYLRSYAERLRVDYDALISGVKLFLENGDGEPTIETWDSEEVTEEFWNHLSIVTGVFVPLNRRSDFTGCCI